MTTPAAAPAAAAPPGPDRVAARDLGTHLKGICPVGTPSSDPE